MTIEPHSLSTMSLDWGVIERFVSPDAHPGAGLSFGEVMLLPGKGHDRHKRPTYEEVLHVLEGQLDFRRLPAGELSAFDRMRSSAPPSSQVDAATGPGVSATS